MQQELANSVDFAIRELVYSPFGRAAIVFGADFLAGMYIRHRAGRRHAKDGGGTSIKPYVRMIFAGAALDAALVCISDYDRGSLGRFMESAVA